MRQRIQASGDFGIGMTHHTHHAQAQAHASIACAERAEDVAPGPFGGANKGHPITNCLAVAAILLALTVAALVVLVHNHGSISTEGGLPPSLFAFPVVLLLAGAFGLKRGSQLARIGLGYIFYLMAASFFFFAGFGVVAIKIPLTDLAVPLLVATVLSVFGLSFFLLERLKTELRDIARNRAATSRKAGAEG